MTDTQHREEEVNLRHGGQSGEGEGGGIEVNPQRSAGTAHTHHITTFSGTGGFPLNENTETQTSPHWENGGEFRQ